MAEQELILELTSRRDFVWGRIAALYATPEEEVRIAPEIYLPKETLIRIAGKAIISLAVDLDQVRANTPNGQTKGIK